MLRQHLLVVVRALEELDPRVERPAVSLDEDLHAVDRRVERVRAEGTALHGRREGLRVGRRQSDIFGDEGFVESWYAGCQYVSNVSIMSSVLQQVFCTAMWVRRIAGCSAFGP